MDACNYGQKYEGKIKRNQMINMLECMFLFMVAVIHFIFESKLYTTTTTRIKVDHRIQIGCNHN